MADVIGVCTTDAGQLHLSNLFPFTGDQHLFSIFFKILAIGLTIRLTASLFGKTFVSCFFIKHILISRISALYSCN